MLVYQIYSLVYGMEDKHIDIRFIFQEFLIKLAYIINDLNIFGEMSSYIPTTGSPLFNPSGMTGQMV